MSPKERRKKIVEPQVDEEQEEVEEASEEEGAEATSTLAPTTSVPTPSHDDGDANGNLSTFDSVYKYLKGKEVGKVHVVSTPQMPALLEINPETVKKYEATSRSWLATYQDPHILRSSWPNVVKSRIDIEWIGSREEQSLGAEWENPEKVPEEIFFGFLKRKFIQKEDEREESKSLFEKFSENLSKKIIVELNNIDCFVDRYTQLHAEFRELPTSEIRPEREREKIKIALKALSVYNSQELTEKWKRKIFSEHPQPETLMKLFQLIKTVNGEYAHWHKTLQAFQRPKSYASSIETRRAEKPNAPKFRKRNLDDTTTPPSQRFEKRPKKEKEREICWTCGNCHPNQACRLKDTVHQLKSWAKDQKKKVSP
jgi:hypothetical protein